MDDTGWEGKLYEVSVLSFIHDLLGYPLFWLMLASQRDLAKFH
jgi:hypothetical protein